MAWLEPMLLAQIHREVYVAILRSWIPHGERGDFARRVGVTREYLSYLCALDRASAGGSITRLPHPQTAKRIADVLPAPPEIKISLLENMLLARERHAEAHYVLREWMAQRLVGELLQEISGFTGRPPSEAKPRTRKGPTAWCATPRSTF